MFRNGHARPRDGLPHPLNHEEITLNSNRRSTIAPSAHQHNDDGTISGTYSALVAAMPLMASTLDWEIHLADWGQEDWAKLFYLFICCDYPLKDIFQLFSLIEVRAAPLDVVAAEFFDDNFKDKVPTSFQGLIDYDEYARICRASGLMSSFIFDSQEYTAIGFA